MGWKDTTSYSRGERERNPTTFTARAGDLRITVTCDHIHHPGIWIMHAEPFYREHELRVGTEAEAKAKAIALVRQKIADVVAALDA